MKKIRVWISRDIEGPKDNDVMIWESKPTLYDTQWINSKKWMDANIWHGIKEGECDQFELRRVEKKR